MAGADLGDGGDVAGGVEGGVEADAAAVIREHVGEGGAGGADGAAGRLFLA